MEGRMQLHPELQAQVIELLPANEQALVGRLVSKDLSNRLSNRTADFRLPLPPAGGDTAWQPHLHQAFKQLNFHSKVRMLSLAAASGSETNLEVAWGLLCPCLHPEMLQRPQGYRALELYGIDGVGIFSGTDPGTTAVEAGHAASVLPWLVRHKCPLDPENTLDAAAQHCDLAGLQAVWQLLDYGRDALGDFSWLAEMLFMAAGRSVQDGAIAKLTWLGSMVPNSTWQHDRQKLRMAAATGAAEAGNLPVLTWLRGLGLDLGTADSREVLVAALRGGHVAVADWLVDEAGCPLPTGQDPEQEAWHVWCETATGGHVECLRWLLRREVPVDVCSVFQAAKAGQLEAVRFLHTECGAELMEDRFAAAAGSGSLPTAAWLLQAGCPMDPDAYGMAAEAGDADMVVWLVQEAGCPWNEGTLSNIIGRWPEAQSSRPGLRRAVGVLLEAGCKPATGVASECAAAAAALGDLVLLCRLHEELGAALGGLTLAAAALGGCEAVLEWLAATGWVQEEEKEGEDFQPYALAAHHGDMATLECLVRVGVAVKPRVVSSAAQRGAPLPLLRWLLERGALWDAETAEAVRRSDSFLLHRDVYLESRAWLLARLGRGPEDQ